MSPFMSSEIPLSPFMSPEPFQLISLVAIYVFSAFRLSFLNGKKVKKRNNLLMSEHLFYQGRRGYCLDSIAQITNLVNLNY